MEPFDTFGEEVVSFSLKLVPYVRIHLKMKITWITYYWKDSTFAFPS